LIVIDVCHSIDVEAKSQLTRQYVDQCLVVVSVRKLYAAKVYEAVKYRMCGYPTGFATTRRCLQFLVTGRCRITQIKIKINISVRYCNYAYQPNKLRLFVTIFTVNNCVTLDFKNSVVPRTSLHGPHLLCQSF